jgi:hypothetical protein
MITKKSLIEKLRKLEQFALEKGSNAFANKYYLAIREISKEKTLTPKKLDSVYKNIIYTIGDGSAIGVIGDIKKIVSGISLDDIMLGKTFGRRCHSYYSSCSYPNNGRNEPIIYGSGTKEDN